MTPASTGRHYDYEDVDQRLTYPSVPIDSVQRAVFLLTEDDTAWNPDSDERDIIGPGRLEYIRHSNGRIDAVLSHYDSRVGQIGQTILIF